MKKADTPIWTVVIIILCLALLIFLIYYAVRTGGIAKLLSGKIL